MQNQVQDLKKSVKNLRKTIYSVIRRNEQILTPNPTKRRKNRRPIQSILREKEQLARKRHSIQSLLQNKLFDLRRMRS
jgi:hypothetical protein